MSDKYGLITIHNTLNYGSLLQTYSLYKAIESLGVDISLIDYQCEAIARRENTYSWRECRKPTDIIRHFTHYPVLNQVKVNMWKFMRENMKITSMYNKNTIGKSQDLFDGYIVGSDIVWGLEITGHDLNYMLEFAGDNKRKLAFASSIGTKWMESEAERIGSALSRFDFISVREQLAAEWVEEVVGQAVPVMCDPTMLFESTFWETFVETDYALTKEYVLVYMCTRDKQNVRDAIAYAKKHKLDVYYLNFNRPENGIKNIKPVTAAQWITLFAKAKVVFSASYHGLLFALYFQKRVFYYNRGNLSRMISFSKELGITHREGTADNLINDVSIDYNKVKVIIEQKRKYSWEILKKELMK